MNSNRKADLKNEDEPKKEDKFKTIDNIKKAFVHAKAKVISSTGTLVRNKKELYMKKRLCPANSLRYKSELLQSLLTSWG